jgi:hypothetical protein
MAALKPSAFLHYSQQLDRVGLKELGLSARAMASGDLVELWRLLPANDPWIAMRKDARSRRTTVAIDMPRRPGNEPSHDAP